MDPEERAIRRMLAANVRRFRQGLHLSIEAASERGDLAPRQWSRIEAGESNTTLSTLVRLSRALRVRVAVLFGEP